MSARIVSSLTDDDDQHRRRRQKKQIGCINGIFHLFERHHFRRISSHHSRRLITGDKTKTGNVGEFETESRKNVEKQSDLREKVKDSMHREARSLSIKTVARAEGKIRVVKHVDSPRPSEATSYRPKERLNEDVTTKTREAHRYSYDGVRESREKTLMAMTMKFKELPRLSLDSRVKSIETSAAESRSNFLRTREFGDHKRSSSSVVAKLMGLEEIPAVKDSVSKKESSSLQKQDSKKTLQRSIESLTSPKQAPSVYGEIEKRIAELEFKKSGKDLRALKQILEAMQKRQANLETEEPEDNSQFAKKAINSNSPRSPKIRPASSPVHKREDSVVRERRNNVKDRSRNLLPEEKKTNRSSKAVHSPKKEKQSHIQTTEMSRVRMLSQSKQTKESLALQNRKHKPKPSSDSRSFSTEQGDSASVQSESDNSLASDVTSRYRPIRAGGKQRRNCKEMDPSLRLLSEDSPMAELRIATIEQPSPVSVLDSKFYIEGSPSPVKKISTAFRDDNEVEWSTQDFEDLPVITRENLGSEFNHKKVESFELFDFPSDDPDHQYVNKILQASSLLRYVDCASAATWLHPTRHLINPKLFDVLEQTEGISQLKFDQRTHKRIVFDTVNEIIVQKLSPEGLLMRGRRCSSAHQLLREVHTEIEHLRPKPDSNLDTQDDEFVGMLSLDMKREPEDWVESSCEIPALALDVERLIFKDLITEIIADQGDRSRGHCRKLFMKY